MKSFKDSRFITFGLMLLLKPGCISGMQILSPLDSACNIARVLLFIYIAGAIVKGVEKIKTDRVFRVFMLLAAYSLWEIMATIINGRTVHDWGVVLNGIGITVFACAAVRTDMDSFIKGASRLLWWYVTVNTITVILFPRGMYATARYSRNYFLSYRTSWFVIYLLAAFFMLLQCEKSDRKEDRWKLTALAVFEMFSMWKVWTATGLFSLGLAGAFLAVWTRIGAYGMRAGTSLLLEAGVFYGIVIKRLQGHLSYLLVNIMGKDLTLTYRTRIWDSAIDYIKKHMLTGLGRLDPASARAVLGYGASHPHCRYLHVMMTTGAVGMFLYILMILTAFKRDMHSGLTRQQSRILSAALLAMLTAGQVESFSATGTYLYLLFIAAAELGSRKRLLEKDKERWPEG